MCLNPILALSIYKNDVDKHVLKFVPSGEINKIEDLKRVYGCDEVFLLPCQKCLQCRQDYAKDWAVRCSLEARCHKFNYFLTLTYDVFHLPFSEKEAHNDFSNIFLKKLSYLLNGKRDRCKFFACVEKGSLTERIHLHCILFLDKELTLIDPVKIGDFYHYHSPEISEVWSFGLHDISPFEYDCAAYVGKYATKQGHCFMSRNLSKSYYQLHRDEIIKDDFKIYVDFNKKNFIDIPKCFVKWFLEDDNLAFNDYLKVEDYRLSQKDLQRLLCILDIQHKKLSSETKLISSKILAFLKQNKFRAERREF